MNRQQLREGLLTPVQQHPPVSRPVVEVILAFAFKNGVLYTGLTRHLVVNSDLLEAQLEE